MKGFLYWLLKLLKILKESYVEGDIDATITLFLKNLRDYFISTYTDPRGFGFFQQLFWWGW